MRTLYIVGNGFDMAHSLNTGYWKFREYLDKRYPEFFLYHFEDLYNIGPIDISDPRISKRAIERWENSVKEALCSEFENKMGIPDIQSMLDFSQSIVVDMNLDGGNIGIKDTMNYYWREQYGYVRKFHEYVKEWIQSIDTSEVKVKKKDLIESEDLFLNFNYTDLLERIYRIEDVTHIHGGIESISEISPVMGHCNLVDIEKHKQWAKEADEEYCEGEASIHNAVVEYLESIFKDTESILDVNSFFWNKLSTVNRVTIIGWSVGEVDRPYLRKIRDSIRNDAKWTFYWYDEKAHGVITEALVTEGIIGNIVVEDFQSDTFWDTRWCLYVSW